MEKPNALIIDIDDTLSNAEERRHYLKGYTKDFEGFFSKMWHDTVNEHIRLICDVFKGNILLLTGRTENFRELTETWLIKHGINYHHLFMKPLKHKFVKDFEFKEDFYLNQIKPYYNVIHAIDDRKAVLNMWQEVGVRATHEKEFRNKSSRDINNWIKENEGSSH